VRLCSWNILFGIAVFKEIQKDTFPVSLLCDQPRSNRCIAIFQFDMQSREGRIWRKNIQLD